MMGVSTTFDACVIRVEGVYWKQHGVPYLIRDQTLAAHIEYVMRPIGEDVRRIVQVSVTMVELPDPAWGRPEGK